MFKSMDVLTVANDMATERPQQIEPLTAEAIAYLETNRPVFEGMEKTGTVRGLNLYGLFDNVMIKHFNLNYQRPDDTSWESVLKFLTDLYQYYDAWLKEQKS